MILTSISKLGTSPGRVRRTGVPLPPLPLLPVGVTGNGEAMLLSFKTARPVLERMYGMTDRPGIVLGRVQNFQLSGWPLPERRKGSAKLGMDETLKLVMAFELLDHGFTPVRTIRMLGTDWAIIRQGLAAGWLAAAFPGLEESRAPADPDGGATAPFDTELVFAPAASRDSGKETLITVPAPDLVGILPRTAALADVAALQRGDASRSPDSSPEPRRHTLVIHGEGLLRRFVAALTAEELATPEEIARAMAMFCADAYGTADPSAWGRQPHRSTWPGHPRGI